MIIEPSHHHHHESEEESEINEGVLGIFQSMLSLSQEDLNGKSSKVMQLPYVGNITIAPILRRKGLPILLRRPLAVPAPHVAQVSELERRSSCRNDHGPSVQSC